jgi:hypothetical protein
LRVNIWAIGALFLAIGIGPSISGSLGYFSLSYYMDWEPDCYAPTSPTFYVYDVQSFNAAVDEFNAYVSDVEYYLDCLQSDAENDLELTKTAIIEGYQDHRASILRELEDASSQLESERYLLN